ASRWLCNALGSSIGSSSMSFLSSRRRHTRSKRDWSSDVCSSDLAEDDFFSVVVLGEALGVPDPAAYYTAELMPALWDDFHAWHRRMGLPRSPLDHIACC